MVSAALSKFMGKHVPTDGHLDGDNLEALWARAEAFGSVSIYSSDDAHPPNRYKATIRFATIGGTSLTADSDFRLPLKGALAQAIERAEAIRGSFK